MFTSPKLSKFTEPLGCGGKLAFAIGGAGVRGQSEGQFVIRTSRVGSDQRCSVSKAGTRRAEISADVGQQSVGVIKAQLALFAREQKRSVDRHVLAQERFDGERVEAALEFATFVEQGVFFRGLPRFVITNKRLFSVGRDIKTIDIA